MQGKKKAVLLSGLVLAMCLSLMIGLTFAWFTDSVRNDGNVIKAGEMQVAWLYRTANGEEDYSAVPEGENPLFKEDIVWANGEKYGYDFRVVNEGNLAAEWKLAFVNVASSGKADLTEVLDVYVDGAHAGTMKELSAEGEIIAGGTLSEKAEMQDFRVEIAMSEDAGNEYQGAAVKFGVALYAKQTNENAEYDDEYVPPTFEAVQEIIAEAEPGDTVTLPAGVMIAEPITVDKALTIDANGATFTGSESASTLEVKAAGVTIENATIQSANKNFGLLVHSGATDVTISGCTFEGTASTMGHAIWTENANGISIENCSFQRPINLANAQNVTVRNNAFSLGYDVNGVTLSGTVNNITIENNTLEGNESLGYASLVRLEQGLQAASTGIFVRGNNVGDEKLFRNRPKDKDISEEQFQSMIASGAIVTDAYAEAPSITAQPQGANYVIGAQDEALPLEVSASVSKGELSYQWYEAAEGSYEGAGKIDSATAALYVPDISACGQKYYYCEVTNTDEAASESQTAVVRSDIVCISVDYDYEGFTFEEIGETTCKLTAYTGSSLRPYIPDTDAEGRTVVEIGKGVFANSKITEVTIPDTVETVGILNSSGDADGAFYNCSSLQEIHFGGQFKFIGDHTFSKCSALTTDIWANCGELESLGAGAFQYVTLREELEFPASLKGSIGSWTFQHCKGIKEITFAGEGITEIGGSAFADVASLETVTLPASVATVGDCLKNCPNLKSLTFERSKVLHGSITSGNPFSSDDTFEEGFVINVPDGSYEDYVASLGSFGTYVAEPAPQEYELKIEGATIGGAETLKLGGGAGLDAAAAVGYDDEKACLGWGYNGLYYADYAELAQNFKMGYGNSTLYALYEKDFTQTFTPSCKTEDINNSYSVAYMEHEKLGEIMGTRYKFAAGGPKYIKIINGSEATQETHGASDGVYNDCPVYSAGKSCILMTFTNNSDTAVKLRYEAEYFGVLGSVMVELGANESKTVLLVIGAASEANNTPFHQMEILSGYESGYDVTICGQRFA